MPLEQKIGMYSETDPLKAVAIWGSLGAEALLAQLYPPSISLFYGDMDVIKARQEADTYATTLRSHGVDVYEVRKELANLLPGAPLSQKQVTGLVQERARTISSEYGRSYPDLYDQLAYLIGQDCERYGEEKAATLNMMLSVNSEKPLGNLLYARDPMNVLLDTMVCSRMAKGIRRPEVDIYRQVYRKLGFDNADNSISIPQGETFEGGDAYIHDKTVYIGVGSRTTLGAARYIYENLKPQIESGGFTFAAVYDPDGNVRPEKEQMDFMHLDTFSMPLAPGNILICEEEASRRQIVTISQNHGTIQYFNTGLSFLEYLDSNNQNIHSIPLEEQQLFGCNFLNLDPNSLVMPIESNNVTNGVLDRSGQMRYLVDLLESTKGYGGAHCMTGQLLRQPTPLRTATEHRNLIAATA